MKSADYHERKNVYAWIGKLRAAGDYFQRRNMLDDIRHRHGDRFADSIEALWRARGRA